MNIPPMHILMVDDRPENLLVLQELLESPTRVLVKANSGNEALKKVLQSNIGLILLDVQMPEMDGFEVAALLKHNPATRHIPIIFITAINKEEKYVLKGLQEGAIDYLYKPLNADITQAKINVFEELYQYEQKLKATNAELTTANKALEALNTQKNYLLGMAAHDLRNPVAAISQISAMLEKELSDKLNEEQLRFLQSIHISSDYMLNLINDLLDVSKIEAGKLSLNILAADLNDIVTHVYEMNKLIASGKMISIHLDKTIQSKFVYLDAVKIEQVMNNLLSNAIKFSPKNTNVYFTVKEDEGRLSITVKDEGQGIPESEQNKLFKAFQTTSVQSTAGEKSTGLGLMISAKIIHAHGGTIGVNSEAGKGASFHFEIPVMMQENSAQPELIKVNETELEKKTDSLQATARLLIVEDDKLAQLVMKKMLKNIGFEAAIVNNGKEAVDYVSKNKVDVILMDMNMPLMNGIDATRTIREAKKENDSISIIGLTASGIKEETEACLAAGMNICLKKPVIISDLMETLKQQLNK